MELCSQPPPKQIDAIEDEVKEREEKEDTANENPHGQSWVIGVVEEKIDVRIANHINTACGPINYSENPIDYAQNNDHVYVVDVEDDASCPYVNEGDHTRCEVLIHIGTRYGDARLVKQRPVQKGHS